MLFWVNSTKSSSLWVTLYKLYIPNPTIPTITPTPAAKPPKSAPNPIPPTILSPAPTPIATPTSNPNPAPAPPKPNAKGLTISSTLTNLSLFIPFEKYNCSYFAFVSNNNLFILFISRMIFAFKFSSLISIFLNAYHGFLLFLFRVELKHCLLHRHLHLIYSSDEIYNHQI